MKCTYEYQIGFGNNLKTKKLDLESPNPISQGELIGLAGKYAIDNKLHQDDVSIACFCDGKLNVKDSLIGKNMEKNKETLKEENQILSTPTFVGTADERLEALNLWTVILTNIKKVTDLPSQENKIGILSFLISESNSTINRISNGSIRISPVQISPELPSQPALAIQTSESIDVGIRNKLYGTDDRMKTLAGL